LAGTSWYPSGDTTCGSQARIQGLGFRIQGSVFRKADPGEILNSTLGLRVIKKKKRG